MIRIKLSATTRHAECSKAVPVTHSYSAAPQASGWAAELQRPVYRYGKRGLRARVRNGTLLLIPWNSSRWRRSVNLLPLIMQSEFSLNLIVSYYITRNCRLICEIVGIVTNVWDETSCSLVDADFMKNHTTRRHITGDNLKKKIHFIWHQNQHGDGFQLQKTVNSNPSKSLHHQLYDCVSSDPWV
jgi:hypothetical protein